MTFRETRNVVIFLSLFSPFIASGENNNGLQMLSDVMENSQQRRNSDDFFSTLLNQAPNAPVKNADAEKTPAIKNEAQEVQVAPAPVATPEWQYQQPAVSPRQDLPAPKPVREKKKPEETGAQPVPKTKALPYKSYIRRLIMQAANDDPGIRSLQEEWEAAQQDIRATQGERLPQINVGASVLPWYQGDVADLRNTAKGDITLSASMPLFDWGRLSRAIDERQYRAAAVGARYAQQLDQLAYNVASTEVQLAKQLAIKAVAQAYQQRMLTLVDMLNGIVNVDIGRRSELVQANARLLLAQQECENIEAEIAKTQETLNKWFGARRYDAAPVYQYWMNDIPSLQQAIGNVSHSAPIREVEAEYQALSAYMARTKAEQLPSVDFVISKGFSADDYGRDYGLQAGFSLRWELFSGFSGMANIAAAASRANAAKYKKNDQQRDLTSRLKVDDKEIKRLKERTDNYQKLTRESDTIRQMFYEQWYSAGRRSFLDVLSSESDYYTYKVNAITSRYDGDITTLRYLWESGGLLRWLD